MSPLADAVLRVSFVLLVGLTVRALLWRRSPALRHAVLAATIVAAPLVGVVGPWLPGIHVAVPEAAWRRETPAAPPSVAALVGLPEPAAVRVSASIPASATSARARVGGIRWTTLALGAWAIGALAAVSWIVVALVRVRRLAARGTPVVDARWTDALDRAAADAGLTRAVRLLAVPDSALLATWGSRRPHLLIPATAIAWSDERVRTVLAHEVAHIVRHDWLYQAAAEALRALLWWHPLAWLACRALRHDSELACDDAVLRAGVRPTAYADELLQIARLAAPALAAPGVMRMARTSTLERRIVAMLNPTLDRRAPSRGALTATALAVGALLLPVALLRAQPTARQALDGVVYDTSGAVLPGVTVILDADTAKVQTTTGPAGTFRFDGVEPGAHVLQVESPGFRALRQPIQLKTDADWNRAVTLQIGEVRETVSVSRRRPATITPLTDGNGPTPVRVGGNIRAPRKVKNVAPEYPERLAEAGLQGKVVVEAVIGIDGAVVRARALTMEAHPEFATAAIAAVNQWRFEPTLLNGKPVEVVMSVTIDFSLQ